MSGAAHFRVVIVASLAGILFGFDIPHRRRHDCAARNFFLPVGLGAATECIVGTLLGALIVGGSGDRYGSRNMLRVVGLLYVISALSCALAWNFKSFVVSFPRRNRHRWILGTCAGESRGSRAGESARSTGRRSKSTS
jgi:MFS family permease